MRRRYLAYGSNLCLDQMRERCPAAETGPVVALPGWRFIINRRGVATLRPCPGGQAWGLVWQLTRECEATLDRYEGVAAGHYTKAEIEVGGSPALVYLSQVQSKSAKRNSSRTPLLAWPLPRADRRKRRYEELPGRRSQCE